MNKGSQAGPRDETPEFLHFFYILVNFFCLGSGYIFLKEGVIGEKMFFALTNQQIYFFPNIPLCFRSVYKHEVGWCLCHRVMQAKGLKPNLFSHLMEILSERDAPAD